MIYIPDRPTITPTQAMVILTRHTQELGMFIDVDRVCDYQIHYGEYLRKGMSDFQDMMGSTDITPRKGKEIIRVLCERYGFDKKLFVDKENSFNLSFGKDNRKQVHEQIEAGMYEGEAVEVFQHVDKMVEAAYGATSFKQFIDTTPLARERSFDGARMAIVKPEWTMLDTHRIQASKPALQNINKLHLDIITYPKNYNLVYADSGQIEPRITSSYFMRDELLKYLIELYDDAYYGQLHFVLISEEEMEWSRNNLSAIKKKDIDPQLRNELKVLGLAAQYGSTNLDRFNRDLASGYIKRIVNHPIRKEMEREVEEYVRNGGDKFYGVFGSEVEPQANNKYQPGKPGWQQHLVRCGINNPVQTTAAELMAESVYMADQILRNKTKHYARITAYVHDAGMFYLHEDDMHLAEELQGCLSYQVRDWIPIRSEGGIGKKEGMAEVKVY